MNFPSFELYAKEEGITIYFSRTDPCSTRKYAQLAFHFNFNQYSKEKHFNISLLQIHFNTTLQYILTNNHVLYNMIIKEN